jgi:LmbE family N-acetylglucosaminyl deacetylase
MKFLNLNNVLCLSPHPDDVELGVMGTIFKYTDTKFDVLCLTKGGAKGYDETNKIDRREEVNNAWKVTYPDNVKIHHSEKDYFEDLTEPGWINYIENKFVKKKKYSGILIPTGDDSMFEHRFVNKFGSALCRFSPMSLIEYHTISTVNDWKPNLFIDIESVYPKKIKSLEEFKSQITKSYLQKKSLNAFHSNFQCSKRGMGMVEQFKIIELLGV